ncbi:hypothetical protein ACVGOW_30455 [Pseudonocardia saturnea]
MTQMVTRVGSSTAPTGGVVTVADLLTRYAPDPLVAAEPATAPVSVGSLLRREGRAPHAQDRPLAPRSRSASDDEPRRGSGALVRRSVIAAGTLLAAGSVFGATVVMDSSSTGAVGDRQASGGYAGEGRLDLPSTPDGAVPTVVDTAAQTDRLDAGGAPPMSWLDVAFPTAGGTPGSGGGTGAPSGSSPASDTVRTPGTPAAQAGDDTDRGGSGGSSDAGSGSGGSSAGGDQAGGTQGDGDQGGRDGGLGSGLQGVGEGVGGPVGGVVGGLGSAVSDVGSTVEGDEPSLIGGLAGSLL